MKLRTRLFLSVGALFLLAFGVSLIFENYTADQNLKEAEANLRRQIIDFGERRREKIEKFLHISLIEEQALIDALLLRFSRDSSLGNALFLDPKQSDLKIPLHSAFLFRNKNWIDFIQTTKNKELTSALVPIEFPMKTTHFIPIDEDFGWVVLNSDQQIDRPFIGIRYNTLLEEEKFAVPIDQLLNTDWGLTILFSPDTLINFQNSIKQNQEMPKAWTDFLNSVEKASTYLRENQKYGKWMREDILKRQDGQRIFSNQSFDRASRCLGEEGEALNNRVIELLQEGDQGIMVSVLASLFPSGLFGENVLAKEAPKGIARFPKDQMTGNAFFTRDVFYTKPLFNDSEYISQFPPKTACDGIGSSIAVISSAHSNRIFAGNTLTLTNRDSKGYLTIGINVDELVQNLTFSTNRSAFLVHKEKVITAFNQEGLPIVAAQTSIPFKKSMLNKKSGLMTFQGKKYYFLHMVPFTNVDLHFYTIEEEKNAFALVHSVDRISRQVVSHVSFNMRMTALVAFICVLLALHRIAKRMTGPISQLAAATDEVTKGKLEGIVLPKRTPKKEDELSTLISSFEQMVVGLKEKEKVKGILNKVVSPEIAQEITKGTIHLGGEERKVTVLFGDIRNFTKMSSEKDPKEVVEMLNNCMTKISNQIDAFGGVIDKYVGDEVMALFGAPIQKEDSALNAVLSALQMVEVLIQWNDEREKQGLPPIEMGFGIHTGIVLAGNMGAENRLNYTVIGSSVNFTSRLCSAAKGMEVLISKETLAEPHVQENLLVEECPPIKVKGYDETFIVYRVKGKR